MNNYTNEFANVDKMDALNGTTTKKAQETKSQAHNAKTDKPHEELQWELNLIVLTEFNSELVLSCFGK